MYICLRRQSVRFCTATAAAVALFFLSGCATKKYIARETDSLNQKIHEVDKNQQNTQKELDVSRASAVTTQQKLDRLNDELQTLKTQLEELRRGAKAAPDGRQPYAVVHVFYATDRKIDLRSASIEGIYGGDRSDNELLSFGTLDVSIPEDHKMGEIERPSIWRFEIREDPEKHMVLLNLSPQDEGVFFSRLSSAVSQSTRKEAFVFVHGYDVSFGDAARRTAQLAYDLQFDGAPILYSWPSKGDFQDYPADEATIEWTTSHLTNFLEKIAANSHASTVHLIAHSMGNRALTASLTSIAKEHPKSPPIFRHVFLAAPDIDAGVFKQLAQTFPTVASHVTLYASSKDKALIASKKFHDYPRAGDTTKIVTIAPRIDTIDATGVDTEFLGHSYYGDNRSILSDIFAVIRNGDPPGKRFGMKPNQSVNPTYWLFRP